MKPDMQLYQLILKRPNRMGHIGVIEYFEVESWAIAAGEASGVDYEVKAIWWGG